MTQKVLFALLTGSVFLFSGCSTRLGNLTIASTNNISGLNTNVKTEDRTLGKSCIHQLLFIPFGDFENRLQIATDNAIDNGHKSGQKGDALINAKIGITAWTIVVYGQNCVTVDGDLIQVNESMSK
jgi:hypothetical protein